MEFVCREVFFLLFNLLIISNNDQNIIKEVFSQPRFYNDSKVLSIGYGSTIAVVELKNKDLVSGIADRLFIWDVQNGYEKMNFTGHFSGVYSLANLPDGNLASGWGCGLIIVWNVEQEIVKANFTAHSGSVTNLLMLPNGDLLSNSGKEIKIWNLVYYSLKNTIIEKASVREIISLPNGYIAAGLNDKSIIVQNLNDGSIKRNFTNNQYRIRSLTLLPSGDLASGHTDGSIKIWNIIDGSIKRIFPGNSQFWYPTNSLAALPNGLLASGYGNGTTIIWNVNDGTQIRTLPGNTGGIKSMVVLSNGELVTGSYLGTITIWY